jgi:predicted transcriptional regulator
MKIYKKLKELIQYSCIVKNRRISEVYPLNEADILPDGKSFGERRSTVKLMVDILEIALNGAGKTEIVYKANLNFRRVQKYLDFLVGKGLISVSSNKRKKYRTTEKGKAFIKRYKETVELIL